MRQAWLSSTTGNPTLYPLDNSLIRYFLHNRTALTSEYIKICWATCVFYDYTLATISNLYNSQMQSSNHKILNRFTSYLIDFHYKKIIEWLIDDGWMWWRFIHSLKLIVQYTLCWLFSEDRVEITRAAVTYRGNCTSLSLLYSRSIMSSDSVKPAKKKNKRTILNHPTEKK